MNLGIESTALGFTAGFTGDEIIRRLETMGVKNGFIQVGEGFSRINLKLKSIDGTEINGQGPRIGTDKVDMLMKQLGELGEGDVLFLSGSIPSSMPDDAYQKIMAMLDGRGVRIVVDATRDLLMKVLPCHPFLIKPNNHELGEIFGVKLDTRQSVIPYGKKLQEMGAVNVLISMAGEGAVLIDENGRVYEEPAPKGKLINGVGAGDSMVAGLWQATWRSRIISMHSTWELQPEVPAHFLRILPPEKRLRLSISRSSDRIRRKGRNENYRLTGCEKYFTGCCSRRQIPDPGCCGGTYDQKR